MLAKSFRAFEMSKLPHSPSEVRQSAPSGWTPVIEQIIFRSMSFTEYEMNSHPLVFLTVISTADNDPIACMQELTSHQHIPPCYSTGQYDPNIHRVYLLLHDNSDITTSNSDKDMILRQLKSKFSPTHTKMLCINSLPTDSPNLQHPDIWEAWRIPMFFPQNAPGLDPSGENVVLGSYLSMEDFMSLRNFCIELFQHEVLPAYERRVSVLSRIVTETRKGMRNVIKNFWRKPQAQEIRRGSSRYRYDKIEAQILLLADTAFNMRDYDAALSMYKLVKDDFKADKAALHIAHVSLMTAACNSILEPNGRLRDINYYCEALSQIHQAGKTESFPLQVYSYYALIISELLTKNNYPPSYLDAAQILLQASSYVSKSMPILSTLLTERAAYCYLAAGQVRKFSLQIVLTGQRFQGLVSGGSKGVKSNTEYTQHSCICFAVAMIFHDRGKWGTIKSRLWRSLADKLKESEIDIAPTVSTDVAETDEICHEDSHAKQALLFLLHILRAVSPTDDTYSGTIALLDAVNAYHELTHEDMWNGVNVATGWEKTSTREILLNETTHAFQRLKCSDYHINKSGLTVIEDLRIPEIVASSVVIMCPLNGSSSLVPHGSTGGKQRLVDLLVSQLQVELSLEKEQKLLNINREISNLHSTGDDVVTTSSSTHLETNTLLLESWADKYLEAKYQTSNKSTGGRMSMSMVADNCYNVPLGEVVNVAITISNTLPIELVLKDFKLILEKSELLSQRDVGGSTEPDSFDVYGIDIVLPSGANQDLLLNVKPKAIGTFTIVGASYILGDKIQVIQNIDKPGPLLLRTQKQRAERQRGIDESLIIKVVGSAPCVRVIVNNGNRFSNILCGEIFQADIEFRNEGDAPASDVCFIFDYPIGVVKYEYDESFLPFFGQSCTAMRLPKGDVIAPGQSIHLKGYFRLCDAGTRDVSLLVSYQQPEGRRRRNCFTNFEVLVSPSLSSTISIVGSKTESLTKTIVLDVLNSVDITLTNMSESDDESDNENAVDEIVPEHLREESEGSTCIDAVLVVGDINTPQTVLGSTTSNGDINIMHSDERMNMFIPVVLHPIHPEVKVEDCEEKDPTMLRHYNSTWLSAFGDKKNDILEKHVQTYDMFSYLSFCKEELQSEMQRAEERRRKAELAGEEFTPRTISQVRRARTSELQMTSSRSGSPSFSPRVTKSSHHGRNHHLLDVIATAEVEHNEATIVIAWTCHWRGKIHQGLNVLHHQKLFRSEFMQERVADPLTVVTAPTLLRGYSDSNSKRTEVKKPLSIASRYAADRLTVTLVAPQAVSWDFSEQGRCPVSVSLDLYSNHPEVNILVSVEALEWVDLNNDGTATQSVPNNAGKQRKRPPVKGLRWEGKSRFVDVVIPPLSSVSLPFLALISREGVYDIKR